MLASLGFSLLRTSRSNSSRSNSSSSRSSSSSLLLLRVLPLLLPLRWRAFSASSTALLGAAGGNNNKPALFFVLQGVGAAAAYTPTATTTTTTTTTRSTVLGKSSSSSSSSSSIQTAQCLDPRQTPRTPFTSSSGSQQRRMMSTSSAAETETTTATATEENTSKAGDPSHPIIMRRRSMRDVLRTVTSSWMDHLVPETPDNYLRSLRRESLPEDNSDNNDVATAAQVNRTKRPVFNGHYVPVRPIGIPDPRLVLYSPDVAHTLLKLSDDNIQSPLFLDWVSGNFDRLQQRLNEEEEKEEEEKDSDASTAPPPPTLLAWATPYALSIMGTRYTSNCPYGTGDGYGDGRAMSMGELNGHELQLKGGGTTPFCRGADGKAVLRSSIREFLASEAMHYLGIATTRALSLVVSETETTNRPWYSEASTSSTESPLATRRKRNLPSLDDPRLVKYSLEDRKQIVAQLRNQKDDPNIMRRERTAITTRVSPSFVRVGHLDLYARRAEKASLQNAETTNRRWDTSTPEWNELERMVWHACYREYKDTAYDPFIASNDVASAAHVLLRESAPRMAQMVADWVRVGFSQGNFNGDNCLVGGRTMDYGPFGFMEEYYPLFAKWTGSGDHFGFMNQPSAGFANYNVLVESVVPVICAAQNIDDPTETVKSFLGPAAKQFQSAVDEVLRSKMGFQPHQEEGDALWQELESLLRTSRVDWTLFFRQLSYVAQQFSASAIGDSTDSCAGASLLEALEGGSPDPTMNVRNPFYEQLDEETRGKFEEWLARWKSSLKSCGALPTAADRMVRTNPKYVLREWMLVDAYTGAERSDEAELFNLFSLIQHPYDEGSESESSRYYRRAPDEALETGGTAFMSCSS